MEHMSMLNANPGTSCWAHCRRSCTTPTVAFATSTFPLTPSFPWCTAARRDRVPPRGHIRVLDRPVLEQAACECYQW